MIKIKGGIDVKEIVNIAIIGCGGIANGKHMPSLKRLEGVHMVAFCDIIVERAEKAKDEFGTSDARVYKDYKELLENEPDVDAVHVCTPNRSHSYISIDAMESGKHVMCEKPMAKTYQDALAMCEAAKRTGKKLTIGYQNRFRKETQYLHQLPIGQGGGNRTAQQLDPALAHAPHGVLQAIGIVQGLNARQSLCADASPAHRIDVVALDPDDASIAHRHLHRAVRDAGTACRTHDLLRRRGAVCGMCFHKVAGSTCADGGHGTRKSGRLDETASCQIDSIHS